jgi:hypothetical protein
MIMPMSTSNASMFPPSSFSYEDTSNACFQSTGVRPRPHWITTEYGGYVSVVFRVSVVYVQALHWKLPAENQQGAQEVREQHHLLQRNARPVEPRRVGPSVRLSFGLHRFIYIYIVSVSVSDGVWVYCSTTTRVLKNISSSIVALVMEKGEHGNLRRRKKKKKM